MGLKNPIFSAQRAPFMDRAGAGTPDSEGVDYSASSGFNYKARNAADTADIALIGTDSATDILLVGNQGTKPLAKTVTYSVVANGSLGNTVIFNVDRAYTITGITEIHKTAGNDAAAVTCYVEKLTGTTAMGSGVSMMSGTFNCKSTANTLQTATLTTAHPNPDGTSSDLNVVSGDRIAVIFSGTLTTLAGVEITITMTPSSVNHSVQFYQRTNADLAGSQVLFTALRPTVVTGVKMSWSTAATDSGTVTVDLTKDTSTTAAGAGTSILTAARSVKTTANTVVSPALTATSTVLVMQPGDRLSYKPTGTLTALAGLCITVTFQPVYGYKKIDFTIPISGVATDQCIFTADRDYWVEDISVVWDVASTSNTTQITRDQGTTAPGAGTGICTAVDTSTTARTVAYGTMAATRLRYITAGDRLGIKNSGTTGSLANVQIGIGLLPR